MIHNKSDTSKDPYQKALNTALRILAGRDHSKFELAQKLAQRDFTQDIVDQVLAACQRFDYINDERTAKVFIRQLNKKGYGKKRIRYELNNKGLKSPRIKGILSKSISETDELECARRVLQKYRKRFEREKDFFRRKEKIYRFLYSRGFPEVIISELAKK